VRLQHAKYWQNMEKVTKVVDNWPKWMIGEPENKREASEDLRRKQTLVRLEQFPWHKVSTEKLERVFAVIEEDFWREHNRHKTQPRGRYA